jgi:RNA polymerase sigma-70 factor (ECF subfamily)
MARSFRTSQLLPLLDRVRAGDRAAWDELYRHVGGRLEALARKMLRRFPAVGRWEQSEDVLQNASVRLLRALREVRPASTEAFLGLAAAQLRRELLDLKRHYCGPEGPGPHHHTPRGGADAPAYEPADTAPDWAELEEWGEFHRQIDGLPERERQVVDLHFYQGLTKAEAAELLGVDVRTVQRLWNAALGRLRSLRRGEGPRP